MFEVISHIQSPKKFDIPTMIKLIGTEILKISECKIIVTNNNKLLDKLSSEDIQLDAILNQTALPHTYNLILRTNCNLSTIICHEMIHLQQYESGRLILGDPIIFDGKEYDKKLEYNERPWEKEAFANQNKIWKEFKKLYK